MNPSSWAEVLDELEGLVDRTRVALANGDVEADATWQAPELGPIPGALRPRAQSLLTELEGLAHEVEVARNDVRASLHRSRRTATSCDRGVALLIDQRL